MFCTGDYPGQLCVLGMPPPPQPSGRNRSPPECVTGGLIVQRASVNTTSKSSCRFMGSANRPLFPSKTSLLRVARGQKELVPLLRSKCLRPRLGVEPQPCDQFFAWIARLRKRLADRLSPKRKDVVNKGRELGGVIAKPVAASHAHEGRLDLRGRPEGLWRERAEQLDARQHRRHHRQRTVRIIPRASAQAF